MDGPQPACHKDAERILRERAIAFSRVAHVAPDSIVYLTPKEETRTLWLYRHPVTKTVSHHVASGMPAFPPPSIADLYLHRYSPTSPASGFPSPPQPPA